MVEVLLERSGRVDPHIFVGDFDQLPPIGAGKPFEDLIAGGSLPWCGSIRSFAGRAVDDHHRGPRINRGEGGPSCVRSRAGRSTSSSSSDPSPERALKTVVEVVAERAPRRFEVDPVREVQVLAPMYKGPVGIDALDSRLGSGDRAASRR